MKYYSREYAIAVGFARWNCNLEDAFMNLKHQTTRRRTRERVFHCNGLEITQIRIDTEGNQFVEMGSVWQPYPDAVREATRILADLSERLR